MEGSDIGGTVTGGAVTAGMLTTDVVTGGTVMAGTVTVGVATTGTVAAGTVATGTLTAGTVTAGTVTTGTLTAGTVTAGVETGDTAALGTLTEGTLTAGVVTLGTLTLDVVTDGVVIVTDPTTGAWTLAEVPPEAADDTDTLTGTDAATATDGLAAGSTASSSSVVTRIGRVAVSALIRPPVSFETEPVPVQPDAEILILVDDGAAAGLSTSKSVAGFRGSTATIPPPSTKRVMPPSNAETCTMPWITSTEVRCSSTTTLNVVPFTTAASIGVSTAKWGIAVCSTLNRMLPRLSMTRVKPLG
jgi:hypothetical protein